MFDHSLRQSELEQLKSLERIRKRLVSRVSIVIPSVLSSLNHFMPNIFSQQQSQHVDVDEDDEPLQEVVAAIAELHQQINQRLSFLRPMSRYAMAVSWVFFEAVNGLQALTQPQNLAPRITSVTC